MGIKIVVIGGGSSYTPELMNGFIRRSKELPISEIWLVDIEEGKEQVSVIQDLSQRMWDAAGIKIKIRMTLDRREALHGADFVITQFRVGRLYARIKDERIPLIHGMLGQETYGAGGIFKALRTIPVMQEIIRDMKNLCPDAWLMNFTNPSGMITEAVIKHMDWEKCIGLCNVPTIAMMKEPALLGKKEGDLTYRFAGLNHFHWHRVWDENGREVTGRILEFINDKNGGTPVNIYQQPMDMDFVRSIPMIPCGYYRYYFSAREMLEHSLQDFRANATRAEQVLRTEETLFTLYKNPALHTMPEELSERGGAYYSDTACECISAIYNNKNSVMVVNTENQGAVSCLPDNCCTEVSCVISRKGASPIAFGEMPVSVSASLQLMKAMEQCTIQAALTGDYGILLQAFALNPLIPNGIEAKRVLDELLVAHEAYLPQLSEIISKRKKDGIICQDDVVRKLMASGH